MGVAAEARRADPGSADPAHGIGRRLAAWVAGLSYADLPPRTVEAAKRQVLDTLASGWAGSDAAGVPALHGLLAERGGKAESTVWAYGGLMPAPSAARLNGMMAAALDYDSLHDEGVVHAGIVVLPAVLAIAERVGAGGRDILTAYIAGAEILIRLGTAVKTRPGWFYTSTFGIFAAAAASARLLGLDATGINHAIGIALAGAGGTTQALIEPTLLKRLQSGLAAEGGVEAALMASRGITGPAQALEGPAGLFNLYVDVDQGAVLDGLGQTFLNDDVTFKKYPSCFGNHAVIEAALAIAAGRELDPADLASVEAVITPTMARLVGSSFDPGQQPQVAAQFSAQYSVACALLHGRLGLAEIEPWTVCEPRVVALAKTVAVRVDQGQAGRFAPAIVTVTMNDGQRYSARCDTLPGTPAWPLSDIALRDKALECFCRGVFPLQDVDAAGFVARILELEEVTEVVGLYPKL